MVSSASSFVLKGLIGFLLAGVAVVGSTYHLPYVGLAAVILLLGAVLSSYPGRGLFPGMTSVERRERLRRQSQEALASASLGTQAVPRESLRRVDGKHLRVTGISADSRNPAEGPGDGIDIEYDDVEIDEDEFYDGDFYSDAPPQLHVIAE
ncbi:hypothetical protein [Stieleria neptunia]|uniref:hypothetical protein n=1 Tax=Stieleria neptunia TaxID=2527979 RepID=UPI0011A71AC6|nr:hypothetical protein [Stieleria neptunia]